MDTSRLASLSLGICAGLTAVLIGVGWQLATRSGVTSSLTPYDLALFRYAIPALLLAPLWWQSGLVPAGVGKGILILMVMGGGLPFGLLGIAGAQFAPAAHMGALLPGAMPVFVAALGALILKDRPGPTRIIGYGFIVAGILAIAGHSLLDRSDGAWRGDLLFLCAALFWAVYTVAFRRSGMTPWQSSALICVWSAVGIIPLWLIRQTGTLFAASWQDVALQVAMQGVVAGIFGLATYAIAIRELGASRAAVTGALVPVLAALGGWLLLGESLSTPALWGVGLTSFGVLLTTGLIKLFARD